MDKSIMESLAYIVGFESEYLCEDNGPSTCTDAKPLSTNR